MGCYSLFHCRPCCFNNPICNNYFDSSKKKKEPINISKENNSINLMNMENLLYKNHLKEKINRTPRLFLILFQLKILRMKILF